MFQAARRALLSVVLPLILALGATACTGSDDEPDAPGVSVAPPQVTDDGSAFEIQTRATLGRVTGRLSRQARKRLPETVTSVVQAWFHAAYVGGDYPRGNFRDAFPRFTAGARARARADLLLMSNKGIGQRIDTVTPTRSRIRIDVLAVRQRPVGVTARFRLAFRTTGELARRVQVSGRLLLTRERSGWRVFGYDVAKSGRPGKGQA